MASPQTAHGYTKIANSIMRALYRFPFSGQELRLLVWVLRDSYGWGEKQTHVAPLSRIHEETGIPQSTASWVIRRLVNGSVLFRVRGSRLSFNKNYDEWLLSQPGMLPLTGAGATKRGARALDPEPRRAAPASAAPSLADVRAYCLSRKSAVDPERFWHHYEATGWMTGRSKVTNWKSQVCFWERTNGAPGRGVAAAVAGPDKCPVCSGPELKKGEKFCSGCARCRRCGGNEDLKLVPARGGGNTVRCIKHI